MFSTFLSDYNKTSDGWLEWRGSQYFINTVRMAMEDARSFCQQRHGDLATINSEAENIFLWQQVIILSVNCCQDVYFMVIIRCKMFHLCVFVYFLQVTDYYGYFWIGVKVDLDKSFQ